MMASIQNKKPGLVAFLPMQGTYDQTPDGFQRLYAWIEEHGFKATGAPTAIYYNIAQNPSGSSGSSRPRSRTRCPRPSLTKAASA